MTALLSPVITPLEGARRAHVAPFHLVHLARSLRPRTGPGRHVNVATCARHRRFRGAPDTLPPAGPTSDPTLDPTLEPTLRPALGPALLLTTLPAELLDDDALADRLFARP